MKEKHYLGSFLFLILALLYFVSCSGDKESIPYSSTVGINDISFAVSTVDSAALGYSCLNVNTFKIQLLFASDNPYGDKYGLNPKYNKYIKEMYVFFYNPETKEKKDLSSSFVVDDCKGYNDLYSTFPEFLSKKTISKKMYDLVFTNLQTIQVGGKAIIAKNEVLKTVVEVEVKLSDGKSYNSSIPLKLTNTQY